MDFLIAQRETRAANGPTSRRVEERQEVSRGSRRSVSPGAGPDRRGEERGQHAFLAVLRSRE